MPVTAKDVLSYELWYRWGKQSHLCHPLSTKDGRYTVEYTEPPILEHRGVSVYLVKYGRMQGDTYEMVYQGTIIAMTHKECCTTEFIDALLDDPIKSKRIFDYVQLGNSLRIGDDE